MGKHTFKEWMIAVRAWSFPASAMPVIVSTAYVYWKCRNTGPQRNVHTQGNHGHIHSHHHSQHPLRDCPRYGYKPAAVVDRSWRAGLVSVDFPSGMHTVTVKLRTQWGKAC